MVFSIGIILFGVFAVGSGLYRLFGPINVWYIIRSPFLTLALYSAIPIGCFFLFLGIGVLLPDQIALFMINLGAFVAFVGTNIMMFVPQLQPRWLQLRYKEHGDILDMIRAEILREGDWNKRVRTQEDLEAWVEEVRANKGM